jgi:hypothetical protein
MGKQGRSHPIVKRGPFWAVAFSSGIRVIQFDPKPYLQL